MDAHRLASVFDQVIAEHNRLAIDHKLAQVLHTVGGCISNPSSTSDEQFRAALTSILAALRRSRTNDFVESDRRILNQTNGDRFTGDGLADRILAVANERPFLAARAKEEYVNLAEELAGYLATLAASKSSLHQLNVESARFGGEDYELGILLPERVGRGDLDAVIGELKAWDDAMRELLGAFSEKTACVSLRNFSSGHFELAIAIDREAALALGTIIGGIYDLYRKVEANRRNADELGRQNYPAEIVGRIKDYEQHIIQLELKAIREAVMTRHVRRSAGRKEVDRLLDRALRFLVLRIRDGADVEILGPSVVDLTDSTGDTSAEEGLRALPHQVRSAMRSARHRKESKSEEGSPNQEAPRLPLTHLAGPSAEPETPQQAA